MSLTSQQLYTELVKALAPVCMSLLQAQTEAAWLMEDILGLDATARYLDKPYAAEALEQLNALLKRRVNERSPLQYLLGKAYFRGLTLEVTPAVLIPRPESEQLVSLALEAAAQTCQDKTACFGVDVGTGSGALALALAQALPSHWQLWALDVSPEALVVAQRNANTYALAHPRLTLLQSDLLEALPVVLWRQVSFIVANLPYIPLQEWQGLEPEVKQHEPKLALMADEDGMALMKRLAEQALKALSPKGSLLLEAAASNAAAMGVYCRTLGYQQVQVLADFAGFPRFVKAVL
jgi:release factor glutamine methyltransferase